MNVSAAEEKWHEAKAAVDKSKYDDDSYYAVVTKVFKKMMGEEKTMECQQLNFSSNTSMNSAIANITPIVR